MRSLLTVLAALLAMTVMARPAAARLDASPTPGARAGDTAFLVEHDAVPSPRDPEIAVTYSVGAKGDVADDLPGFRRTTARVLNDDEGWAAGGRVAFVEAQGRPDFRLWLAAPGRVAAANSECDADFSCRVGDDVYINVRRWRVGTDSYRHRPLAEYRRYVINHEVGHWLGLDHPGCGGVGEQAPVMLQQSKSLDGCDARALPLAAERRNALRDLRRR